MSENIILVPDRDTIGSVDKLKTMDCDGLSPSQPAAP
jgi:hypothetical protein